MILATEFAQFIESITLGDAQRERIQSAVEALVDHLQSELSLPPEMFFLQGSFVNGTAVKPPPSNESGEYDVDLVVVMAGDDESAEHALDRLCDAIKAHGRYEDRVANRKPCVRVEYAEDEVGRFHIDVIPLKDDPTEGLMAPRRGEGWHKTRPNEYTDWCLANGEPFSRTVRLLKRWRDEHQSARTSVKSIVLQVLAADNLGDATEDSSRLRETLVSLSASLDGLSAAPEVLNPALPEENLAARWNGEQFRNFVRELREAADIAVRAEESPTDSESSDLWRELLGSEFPAIEADGDVAVGNTAHAWSLDRMGWTQRLDPSYAITMDAEVYRQRLPRPFRGYPWHGVLPDAVELRYVATVAGPAPAEIWWQVINTGSHAESEHGLRGEIFRAKDRLGRENTNQAENWEHTLYTGGHVIEAFAVRGVVVVARTGRLPVLVENRARPPRGRRRRDRRR